MKWITASPYNTIASGPCCQTWSGQGLPFKPSTCTQKSFIAEEETFWEEAGHATLIDKSNRLSLIVTLKTVKFLPKVSDPQGQWMICVGSWGACFRRAFVIIWSWGTNRKHFFSGLNLTAHDTQLITGLFEKQPQNAGGVKSTFGQENTKSSLYLLILEHTHTHTGLSIYLKHASAFHKLWPIWNHQFLKWTPEGTNARSHTLPSLRGEGGRERRRWKMPLMRQEGVEDVGL